MKRFDCSGCPLLARQSQKTLKTAATGSAKSQPNKTQTLFEKCCRLPCPARRVRLRGDFGFGGITL
jgi:hypothetical protein